MLRVLLLLLGGMVPWTASAEQRFTTRDGLTANVADGACGPRARVTVHAPDAGVYAGDRLALQRLLGGVRMALVSECPRLAALDITGRVNNRQVYRATVTAAQGWQLPPDRAPSMAGARPPNEPVASPAQPPPRKDPIAGWGALIRDAVNHGAPPPGARPVPMPQDGHWLTGAELRQFAEGRTLYGSGVLARTAGDPINWHLDGRMIHQVGKRANGVGRTGYHSFPYSYQADALCWRHQGQQPCARVRRLADGTHVLAIRGGDDFIHVRSSAAGDPLNLAVVAPRERARQANEDAALRELAIEFARPEHPDVTAERDRANREHIEMMCRSRPAPPGC